MGGIGQVLSCLEAEIFLLADLAILATWKFVSNEMKSGVTAYTNWTISLFFFLNLFACQLLEERRSNLLWWKRRRCIRHFIFAIVGSGEDGGSCSG